MVLHFTAFYGLFDKNMHPKKVIDVSKPLQDFIEEGKLTLPRQTDLDSLFPNCYSGVKYLQVKTGGRRIINIRNDDYCSDVVIDLLEHNKPISIVYFVFINPQSNWKAIIGGQLSELSSYGLLDEANLNIHVTDLYGTKGVLSFISKASGGTASITQSFTNEFEYPAIRLLHTLAGRQPDTIFMYLHTKGMSRNIKRRYTEERVLLENTFGSWRRSLQAFEDESVNKIGLFPSIDMPGWGGWIWYNFFMARGSYLAGCRMPEMTTDRFYYESWLATQNGVVAINDCYSLFTNQKDNFSQAETGRQMDVLVANYKRLHRKRKISLRLRYPWIIIRK